MIKNVDSIARLLTKDFTENEISGFEPVPVSSLEEQIGRLQCLVAHSLEKNECLRQGIAGAEGLSERT